MNIFPDYITKILSPKSVVKANEKDVENQTVIDLDSFKHNGAYVTESTRVFQSQAEIEKVLHDQAKLILEYRKIEKDPELDFAIDHIVNDAVVQDQGDNAVDIDLDKIDMSDAIKEKIIEAHQNIMNILSFDVNGYDIFRRWYVDGTMYLHNVVDKKKPKEGIKQVVVLDPKCMKKIVDVKRRYENGIEVVDKIREYYAYNTSRHDRENTYGFFKTYGTTIEFPVDSIVHVNSGIFRDSLIQSNLERSRKVMKDLSNLENMLVVFRLTRGVDRRAFYIDVGSLATKSVEKYINMISKRYKSKLSYNSSTGDVGGMSNAFGIQDDYFLPRREGGKGTEIQTLDGSTDFLRDLDDIAWFMKKLRRSTKVPLSRFDSENSGGLLGSRLAEITRDELLFSKYVSRLQTRFSTVFATLLKRHLILTRVISAKEWDDKFEGKIKYSFTSDEIIKIAQENEVIGETMQIYETMKESGLIGKFYSNEYVQKNVLRMSDEDIEREQEKIKAERKDGFHAKTDEFGDPIAEEEGAF